MIKQGSSENTIKQRERKFANLSSQKSAKFLHAIINTGTFSGCSEHIPGNDELDGSAGDPAPVPHAGRQVGSFHIRLHDR